MIGAQPPERADAARNRARILAAASKLFAERGVSCTSMDAIAAEAGVGKGTLFRRFGDRATLARTVLDQSERELQDGFLSGPPPLGPGAPAAERIVAFGAAMFDNLEINGELLLEAERSGYAAFAGSAPGRVQLIHLRSLLGERFDHGERDYLADLLLGALRPSLFRHQRGGGMSLGQLKDGYRLLVERLLAPD